MNKLEAHSSSYATFGSLVSLATVGILLTLLSFVLAYPPGASSSSDALSCSAALGQTTANTTADAPGLSEPIRLLSWNIQKSQTVGWWQDLQKFGKDRHLLLIQEASTQASISSALPQALYQAFAAGYTNESQTTGVLTLSSVEPSLQCNLTAWEPWLGTPKATNITEYPLAESSDRLLVINLHAVNFTVGTEEFVAQIEALSPLLSNHRGPLLVAGDFNTWSNARHRHLVSYMKSHHLSAVDFSPDIRTTFWNKPLDHVYLRGLRAVKAQVVPVDTSDHNPMLVTLEFSL